MIEILEHVFVFHFKLWLEWTAGFFWYALLSGRYWMLYTLFLNSVKVHTLKRGLFSFILSGKIYLLCMYFIGKNFCLFFQTSCCRERFIKCGSKKEKEKKEAQSRKSLYPLNLNFSLSLLGLPYSLDQSAF